MVITIYENYLSIVDCSFDLKFSLMHLALFSNFSTFSKFLKQVWHTPESVGKHKSPFVSHTFLNIWILSCASLSFLSKKISTVNFFSLSNFLLTKQNPQITQTLLKLYILIGVMGAAIVHFRISYFFVMSRGEHPKILPAVFSLDNPKFTLTFSLIGCLQIFV